MAQRTELLNFVLRKSDAVFDGEKFKSVSANNFMATVLTILFDRGAAFAEAFFDEPKFVEQDLNETEQLLAPHKLDYMSAVAAIKEGIKNKTDGFIDKLILSKKLLLAQASKAKLADPVTVASCVQKLLEEPTTTIKNSVLNVANAIKTNSGASSQKTPEQIEEEKKYQRFYTDFRGAVDALDAAYGKIIEDGETDGAQTSAAEALNARVVAAKLIVSAAISGSKKVDGLMRSAYVFAAPCAYESHLGRKIDVAVIQQNIERARAILLAVTYAGDSDCAITDEAAKRKAAQLLSDVLGVSAQIIVSNQAVMDELLPLVGDRKKNEKEIDELLKRVETLNI